MGERGSICCYKVPVFPLLSVGLAVAVIITTILLIPEARHLSQLSSKILDGKLFEQRFGSHGPEFEVAESQVKGDGNKKFNNGSSSSEVREEEREEDNSTKEESTLAELVEENTVDNRITNRDGPSDIDVLDFYKKWDSKVGCVLFKEKLVDEQRNSSIRSLQPWDRVKCADLQKLHVSVLVRQWTWIPDALNGFHTCRCGLTCLWTKSDVVSDDPDLHFYEGSIPPFQRNPGDPLRAYVEMESHRTASLHEDIFVSYHSSADVQTTYASNALSQNRNHFISPRKRTDVLVYWSSSRCVEVRQQIASGFLPLISHHSFGKCLNNVGPRQDQDEDPIFKMYPECKANGGDIDWTHHIHCAMSHYMFALAIENTMTESYVTEKLFYPLEIGTVPIYFGASNVLDLVPPNSIIQASKFSSVEELVAYVKEVANDPVQYAEFHAWRRCAELGNYRHTWDVSFDTLPCRLCATVSKLGGKGIPAS